VLKPLYTALALLAIVALALAQTYIPTQLHASTTTPLSPRRGGCVIIVEGDRATWMCVSRHPLAGSGSLQISLVGANLIKMSALYTPRGYRPINSSVSVELRAVFGSGYALTHIVAQLVNGSRIVAREAVSAVISVRSSAIVVPSAVYVLEVPSRKRVASVGPTNIAQILEKGLRAAGIDYVKSIGAAYLSMNGSKGVLALELKLVNVVIDRGAYCSIAGAACRALDTAEGSLLLTVAVSRGAVAARLGVSSPTSAGDVVAAMLGLAPMAVNALRAVISSPLPAILRELVGTAILARLSGVLSNVVTSEAKPLIQLAAKCSELNVTSASLTLITNSSAEAATMVVTSPAVKVYGPRAVVAMLYQYAKSMGLAQLCGAQYLSPLRAQVLNTTAVKKSVVRAATSSISTTWLWVLWGVVALVVGETAFIAYTLVRLRRRGSW